MARRFPALTFALVVAVPVGLAGCASGGTSTAGTAGTAASQDASAENSDLTPAERSLRNRADALQKTMVEATALGAGVGVGVGCCSIRRALVGLVAGAAAGAVAGGYVGAVQEEYADEEERLDRIVADLERTNEEAEAALVAMRQVLDEQRSEIAAIRAQVENDAEARDALEAELAELRSNVDQMERAIDGAEGRRNELGEARGVVAVSAAADELDPRLDALSRRITAMREIADALAEEV